MHKIGIIGIGRWGKRLIEVFSQNSEVAYACSRGSKENIDWLAQNFPSVKHTTDLEILLSDAAIDVVIIATPIDTHFEIVKKALLHGKHVFCEKPLATSSLELNELYNLANQKKLTLFTGYTFLYNEVFEKVSKIVSLEDIVGIHINWNKMGTFKEDIVWNLATHPVSIIESLMGHIDSFEMKDQIDVMSNSDVICFDLLAKEVRCSIYINRFSNLNSFQCTIKTTKSVYLWQDNILYLLKNGQLEEIFRSSNTALENESKTFLQQAGKGSEPMNKSVSLSVTRILEKANS